MKRKRVEVEKKLDEEVRKIKRIEHELLGKLKLPKIFKYVYPKIFLFILIIILSYYIFRTPVVVEYLKQLENFGYFGIFAAGILFAFGFTAPIAIGLFIILQPPNILLASLIGGFGALFGDLFIFNVVRLSLLDEFNRLKKTKALKSLKKRYEKNIAMRIRYYLLYLFIGFVIASPLPDELGVSMLAGLGEIRQKTLALLSFLLNTLGIFVIIFLSHKGV